MMDRLTLGDKLVAGGGLLFFILSFIGPWWKIEAAGGFGVPGVSLSGGAWDYGILMKGSLILALVYAGWVLLKAGGVEVPDLPSATHMGLGAAIVVLYLLQVVIGPPGGGEFFGVEVSRGLMMFIAIIPVAALGYGAYLKWQEEGAAPAMGTPPPAAPPPPPAP